MRGRDNMVFIFSQQQSKDLFVHQWEFSQQQTFKLAQEQTNPEEIVRHERIAPAAILVVYYQNCVTYWTETTQKIEKECPPLRLARSLVEALKSIRLQDGCYDRFFEFKSVNISIELGSISMDYNWGVFYQNVSTLGSIIRWERNPLIWFSKEHEWIVGCSSWHCRISFNAAVQHRSLHELNLECEWTKLLFLLICILFGTCKVRSAFKSAPTADYWGEYIIENFCIDRPFILQPEER